MSIVNTHRKISTAMAYIASNPAAIQQCGRKLRNVDLLNLARIVMKLRSRILALKTQ